MKRTPVVLLYCPDPTPKGVFGGGVGGILRIVDIFLKTVHAPDFDLKPCYHSVRTNKYLYPLFFPVRLLKDAATFWRQGRSAQGVHLILQYRQAIYREYLVAKLAQQLRLPLLVDIRAGAFIDWYETCSALERRMANDILHAARLVIVEGEPYIPFLKQTLGIDAHYIPTYVPDHEVPSANQGRVRTPLRVLFVGYCYPPKGIRELVQGARLVAERGVALELNLVGHEEASIKAWLDQLDLEQTPGLRLRRWGLLSHDAVLERYAEADIFCFPTWHPGEGQSNAVNEAMMMNMVIVCTRHGFLESTLGEEGAYFVRARDAQAVAEALHRIHHHPEEAIEKANQARRRFMERFTQGKVAPELIELYRTLLQPAGYPIKPPAAPEPIQVTFARNQAQTEQIL